MFLASECWYSPLWIRHSATVAVMRAEGSKAVVGVVGWVEFTETSAVQERSRIIKLLHVHYVALDFDGSDMNW